MILDDVTARLASFGYIVTTTDAWLLEFIINKVENHIKSQCNTSTVPEDLYQIEVDMVVGEFLFGKKNMGQLADIDLSAAIKSIQEGDTNITFAIGSGSMTAEQRLDALISSLMHPNADFASYRRIKW